MEEVILLTNFAYYSYRIYYNIKLKNKRIYKNKINLLNLFK